MKKHGTGHSYTLNTQTLEVRTTVHTVLMDEDDVNAIIHDLENCGYQDRNAKQNFTHSEERPTLRCIREQERVLNTDALYVPANFTLEFRNF
ncbi:MAG: hypothetical protein WBK77_04505 [Alphaproteobacteria bacterium]